jgi:hypothetical protein
MTDKPGRQREKAFVEPAFMFLGRGKDKDKGGHMEMRKVACPFPPL